MKNKIRQILAVALAAALIAALWGCSRKKLNTDGKQQEAAVKVSEEILTKTVTGEKAPKYETGDAHVSEEAAEVHVKVGDRDFIILLTKDADGNWEGEAPKELTEYLEELKKPEQPENPENPDQPDNPDNPEQPDNPENPDNPEQPDTPENPDQPENPENPDVPENPDTPENPPKEEPDPKEDPNPKEDPKPKHEHKYTEKVTKEPTCTKEGVKTYTCSCGDSYTKPIKAKGHKYKDSVVAPTKTAKGYTLHTCTVCGYEYKDKFTDPIAEDPKPKEDPKPVHTHEWEEVYETVHHKECVHEAWDEEIWEVKAVCKVCGKWYDTATEVGDHIIFEHDGVGSYTAKEVVVKTIHHDAEYKEWDEKVLTGYKCKTCGETKGVGGNAVVLPEDKKRKAAKTNNNYLLQYS